MQPPAVLAELRHHIVQLREFCLVIVVHLYPLQLTTRRREGLGFKTHGGGGNGVRLMVDQRPALSEGVHATNGKRPSSVISTRAVSTPTAWTDQKASP